MLVPKIPHPHKGEERMSLVLDADEQTLRQRFFALGTPEDIAALLEIKPAQLTYHLCVTSEDVGPNGV